jgi:hypothetical protein
MFLDPLKVYIYISYYHGVHAKGFGFLLLCGPPKSQDRCLLMIMFNTPRTWVLNWCWWWWYIKSGLYLKNPDWLGLYSLYVKKTIVGEKPQPRLQGEKRKADGRAVGPATRAEYSRRRLTTKLRRNVRTRTLPSNCNVQHASRFQLTS